MPVRHWTDLWGVRFLGEKGTLNVTSLGYEFKPKGQGAAEGAHREPVHILGMMTSGRAAEARRRHGG